MCSGDNDGVFIGFCMGVIVMAVFIVAIVDGYQSDFKHNNVVEVGGKHYKIVEVVVNTQYEEVVK